MKVCIRGMPFVVGFPIKRIGRTDLLRDLVTLRIQGENRLFVRDCDTEAAETERIEIIQATSQLIGRHPDWDVDAIETDLSHHPIVQQRAEAMSNRIADHTEQFGFGVELFKVVQPLHIRKG